MNQEAYDELLVQYSITSQQLGGLSGTAVGETRLLGGKVERLRSELIDAYAAALARIAELEAQLYDEGEGRLVQAYEAIERDTRIAQLEAQLAQRDDERTMMLRKLYDADAALRAAQVSQREWEVVDNAEAIDCTCDEECGAAVWMNGTNLYAQDGEGYLVTVDLGDDLALCRRVK